MSNLMDTYGRIPIRFEHGKGVYLYDQSATKYLDATSGYGVCGLGHSNPRIGAVVADQANTLVHTSNLFEVPLQDKLAERLCAETQMDKAYFCNSGSEANEAALKIVQKHASQRKIKRPKILVMVEGFHGRTLGSLSATHSLWKNTSFSGIKTDFCAVPLNDHKALANYGEDDDVVAVMLEPILGVGGVEVATNSYLQYIRKLCSQHDWLMVVDEVQTGIGRTGLLAAYMHSEIIPDVVTFAKCLGNGFPVGVCLAKSGAAKLLVKGDHGTTFGGSPFVCRIGLEVLSILSEEDIYSSVRNTSAYLFTWLSNLMSKHVDIVSVKGRGLMIGIEFATEAHCISVVERCLENHLLVTRVNKRTIRLLPALNISQIDAQNLISLFELSLNSCTKNVA